MSPDFNVAILGPGAIGGFIAAVLWRYGVDVTCVARESTAEIINRDGIRFESVMFGDFVARTRAVAKLDIKPDLLFVTTKATSLEAALERVDKNFVKNTIIIPLLNGIEHVHLLRDRYGPRVVPGIISIESKYLAANHIAHVSPFARIRLASDHDVLPEKLVEVTSLLNNAGIETKVLSSEAEVLWGKLVRLNALACTTAASDREIGYIRTNPQWREWLINCVEEGVAVARAHGVEMEPEAVLSFIDALPDALGTSMQRDIAAGRQPELDAITGSVIRAGKRKGLACPTIEKFYEKIQQRIAATKKDLSN
jgi:2-dehydropantoate 2-reductase